MTTRLTWRNNGTWAVISFGLALIGYWLIKLVFTVMRARAGSADIETVATGTTLSIKGIAAGVVIAAIGAAARVILTSRKQPGVKTS
ncbi:MAG TPA: hypothetical protein VM146_03225 [Steroidobacteraceae bacterium]|nr:hypothetical protein [Steroidobacteraceae bacterium]